MRDLIGVSVAWVALSLVLDGLTVLLLPFRLAAEVDGRHLASVLGIVTLLGLGAATIVQPVAGAIFDRLDHRIGRRSALAGAATGTVVALCLFGWAEGVVAIGLAFLLVQLAAATMQAVQQTFIPERIPSGRRGRASGLKGAFDVGGAFIGFLLLAPLLEARLPGAAIAVLAAAIAGCTLAAIVLVPRRTVAPPSDVPLDSPARRAFVALVAARFLFLLGIFGIGRFLLLLVGERLGLDPEAAAGQTAVMFALLTLVTAVSAPVAGLAADRVGRPGLMAAGAVLASAGILGLAGASAMPSLLLFGSLMAIGSGTFSAGNWAMTSDVVAGHQTGRLMGLANLGTGGAAALAGAFGFLVDAGNGLQTGVGYGLLAVVAAASTLGALVPLRRLVSLPAAPMTRLPSDPEVTR